MVSDSSSSVHVGPSPVAPPSGSGFHEAVRRIFERVGTSQSAELGEAADLITAALGRGGVVQTFGAGHSQGLAMEVAGRAGGLVPTNMLALRDVVVYGGDPPEVLHDPLMERGVEIAHRIFDLANVAPPDVFVIASSSGVNGAVVELASLVTQRGHGLVAITSRDHTELVDSRHPSGRKLYEFADVVLDNGAPYGDALLPLPGGGTACAVSSITGSLLAQMLVAEVISRLLAAGETPPVYLSDNVPGGGEHNRDLERRYDGRIRRSA